jgi:outer membrane lipoprotein SlyB
VVVPQPSPPQIGQTVPSAIGQMHTTETVVVVSVRMVEVPHNSWEMRTAGSVTGALAGAVLTKDALNNRLGYPIGGVLGWIGGAAAVDRWDTLPALEIVARRNDGVQVVVVQENEGWIPWIGQEARLIGNGTNFRIAK